MARSTAVWGIDIGNCSLKALRCRINEQGTQLVADAFDYIEYPKILTQPGAEPAELVDEALKQFLSRNTVHGDRVAISVPGQNGLARFIKLPPVEAKKIPDIVRYEAKQQIPFDLQDVVWDYQRMSGGAEEEGFVLETEIGLFAMKRDQVFRALAPFKSVGIEVDVVQLTPLSLFNYLAFDQLQDLPPPDEYDPDSPPPSIVLLSLGTDATDLVITNGYRVWQRSIPLGGNHFTKALTKELKLTFAKAEHLKRNATTAEDPKAVYQAMRPVFNDLLTEIQRSIGYFTSIDRAAKIERMVAMGNGMRLPGLRRYLSQSLGFEVVRLESFDHLVGPEVLNAPAFKENAACFGVCYGLALQGFGKGTLRTNLVPSEIIQDRLVRGKKPWAVAAAAVILMACTISFASHSRALSTVDEKVFADAERQADSAVTQADDYDKQKKAADGEFESTDQIGKNLTGGVEGRLRWLELIKAVAECLPRDEGQRPAEIAQRQEVHITNIECQAMEKLEDWFAAIKQTDWYQAAKSEQGGQAAPVGAAPVAVAGSATGEGPTGSGYLIQLTGYHYHNREIAAENQGAQYVRNTLIKGLQTKRIMLPTGEKLGDKDRLEWVSMKDLGISYPVLIDLGRIEDVEIPDPNWRPQTTAARDKEKAAGEPGAARAPAMTGGPGPMMGPPGSMMGTSGQTDLWPKLKLRRFRFVVQFCWQPVPPAERQKLKAQAEQAKGPAAAPPKAPAVSGP
jgi:type IV pilus assembly protein PilM